MGIENLEVREFKEGDLIIREGRFGREMYILIKGKVEVSLEGIAVAQIDAKGSFFGEICALLGTRRMATVKALTPCKAYVIENLSQYFSENPESGFYMAKTLAARLIDMNKNFVELKKTLLAITEKGESWSPAPAEKEKIQKAIQAIQTSLVNDALTGPP